MLGSAKVEPGDRSCALADASSEVLACGIELPRAKKR
jgi:hypothetical protein